MRDTLPVLLLVGAIALLLAIYLRLWFGLLQLPALGGVDFVSFYTGGRIVRSGSLERLYDLNLQHTIQVTIVGPNFVPGGTLPYNHPPFLAPLLGLIALDDYRAAYIGWTVVLLLVLAICCVVAIRFLLERGFDRRMSTIVALSAILFYPVFISVLKGQDTAFVLLGALVWMWAMLDHRDRLAGVALALTTIKPQIGLALALPLLASRRPAGWWFCAATATLMLYGTLLIGWRGWLGFLDLLSLTSRAEGFGINQSAMYNFTGLMLRSVPLIDPTLLRSLSWGLFLLSIGALCWLWWSKGEMLTPQHIGLTVVVSVFASPHLHLHDLSLLLVPALGAVALLWQRGRSGRLVAIAILPVGSLLLFASDLIKEPLHYVAGYALMLALGAGLGATMWSARRTPQRAGQEV
jgi:hypothetical protein